jgi:hypothetical protein
MRNGARLLCADGVIRAAELAETADTFFSVPASVRVNGKRVSGFMGTSGKDNLDSATELRTYTFHQHTNGDNAALLPEWPCYENAQGADVNAKYASYRAAHNAILIKAHPIP